MTSPWRTTEEAAEYLRLFREDGSPNTRAALDYIDRYIPRDNTRRRGRVVLVHIDDLEGSLKPRRTA